MNHCVPYQIRIAKFKSKFNIFFFHYKVIIICEINLIVYVARRSGILEGSINNANYVQVKTPSTRNITIFQPAPVMIFNISQTIVPSIATFRLRNINSGYSIRSFDVIIV
jgi:hypothetical protein